MCCVWQKANLSWSGFRYPRVFLALVAIFLFGITVYSLCSTLTANAIADFANSTPHFGSSSTDYSRPFTAAADDDGGLPNVTTGVVDDEGFPNFTLHYIRFSDETTRPSFTFLYYLSVLSGVYRLRPRRIYLHGNVEPEGEGIPFCRIG